MIDEYGILFFCRKWKVIFILGFTLLLSGCATSLAEKSIMGDTSQLSQMLRAGQIGPNEPIAQNNGIKSTPFCIFAMRLGADMDKDLLFMLEHGALVNQQCTSGTPLDDAARLAYVDRNIPGRKLQWEDRARFLLAHGGKLNRGGATFVAFQERVNWWSGAMDKVNKEYADDAERKRQEAKDSFFSAENLGTAIAIAGGAVNNYSAAKRQSPSVPNSIQQVAASRQAPSTLSKPVTAGCLQAGAFGNKSDITPACSQNRNNTFGWGNTKAAACEGANRSVREEFDGKNAGGCYCQQNEKVNSVTQPFVCWVMFD